MVKFRPTRVILDCLSSRAEFRGTKNAKNGGQIVKILLFKNWSNETLTCDCEVPVVHEVGRLGDRGWPDVAFTMG